MTAIERIKGRGRVPRAALYARFSSDNNVPGSLKGNDARLTDDSEPCDVHMILARFSRKKIHAFIPRDKNVSKIGGGEGN